MLKVKITLIYMFIICMVPAIASCSIPSPTFVNLLVVDEDGAPIKGADVNIFIDGYGGNAEKGTSKKGKTDSGGKYSSTMLFYNGYISCYASMIGYYDTRKEFQNVSTNANLKLVLRKIINPVPMYARNTQYAEKEIKIPVVGKDVGFDLIAYDFLPPYGNGVVSDLIFNLKSKIINNQAYEYNLNIGFEKGNGILEIIESTSDGEHFIGSDFKMLRFAPESGYQNNIHLFLRRTPSNGLERSSDTHDYRTQKCQIFKIRTAQDKNGISAMYGKISSGMRIGGLKDGKAVLILKYYINPDHTRNLEFDPKRNLFSKLTEFEQVKEP